MTDFCWPILFVDKTGQLCRSSDIVLRTTEILLTLDHLLSLFPVPLNEQSCGKKERATKHADEARHVQSVLETQELDKQITTTVRRHYQITRLQHKQCSQKYS